MLYNLFRSKSYVQQDIPLKKSKVLYRFIHLHVPHKDFCKKSEHLEYTMTTQMKQKFIFHLLVVHIS